MSYSTVLLDLDHTLFDFDASERAAFSLMVDGMEHDLGDLAQAFARYKQLNSALWKLVEQGQLLPRDVRDRRTIEFCQAYDLDAGADHREVMTERFVNGLGDHGELFSGARELLDGLQGVVAMGLATNGISQVQRAKMARLDLDQYFSAVVISDEVGVAKPETGFFDLLLRDLGDPPRESVLMVGDSLNSDIRGGSNSGIATCWFNPDRNANRTGVRPTYELADLTALPSLL